MTILNAEQVADLSGSTGEIGDGIRRRPLGRD